MRTLLIPLVLLLVACATPPSGPDLAACRSDAAGAPGTDSVRKRTAFVDECMHRKGWRPTPACAETDMQGTAFCEYVK
jgi:hypothetical protein